MSLNVRDSGDGPVLVLLHAFPCDGRMWEPQAAAATGEGWRVLVPDLPGFGDSALPAAAPSLDTVADLVVDALDERDVSRCVLGGISLGGYVSMAIARRRPDLVAGLVMCDTKATADGEAARENRERLACMCEDAPDDTARILEQAVLPGLLGDTTRADRPEVVERVRGWLGDASAEAVAWYQRAMAGRPDSQQVLRDLDVPLLVVWGEEDALSGRAEQDLMLACSSDAVLAAVSGAGHLSNVEDPRAVSTALVEYLRVVRGPRHA